MASTGSNPYHMSHTAPVTLLWQLALIILMALLLPMVTSEPEGMKQACHGKCDTLDSTARLIIPLIQILLFRLRLLILHMLRRL